MKRPYERLFRLPRRSINGMALPSWLLTPGTVLLRRHVRNKGSPFCDPVELVEGSPTYSVVRLPDGRLIYRGTLIAATTVDLRILQRILQRVLSEPSCCCRYYVFLMLLFVSADGNCDFVLMKA